MYAIRKQIKACQGKGQGILLLKEWQSCSPLERVAVLSLFLHRTSGVHVNLFHLIHNTVDTASWSLHQVEIFQLQKTDGAFLTNGAVYVKVLLLERA